MRSVGLFLILGVSGFLAGMGYSFGNDVQAEESRSNGATVYDCKRRLATDTTVRCVCLDYNKTYFCNFPIPKNRFGGPK
jgi:hypothetical protein